jgi:hypothetical protein
MRQLAVIFIAVCGMSSACLAVPVYLAPDRIFPSGHYNRDWLKEHTFSQTTFAWRQVRTRTGKTGWVPQESLLTRTDLMNGALAYTKVRTGLREQKRLLRAEVLSTVAQGQKIEINRVEDDGQSIGQWVSVRANGYTGFIPRQNLILASEIPERAALVLQAQLPLRTNTAPSAATIAKLEILDQVQMLSAKQEDWGQVTVSSNRQMWWPMNDESDAQKSLKLLSSQLFKRRLFDMAASPVQSGLKLASAQGIFRTVDGETWEQIPQFRDQDHPISISDSGRIFVGPYYSDDQGVTFNEYIRWDKLLSGVSELKGRTQQGGFKILEVNPSKLDSEKVSVLMDIGNSEKLSAYTSDLGLTWSLSIK